MTDLRRTVLPNGLTVLSESMPGVRSVALGAWVRAASLHESARRWASLTCSSTWCSRERRRGAPRISRSRSRRSADRSTRTRRASTRRIRRRFSTSTLTSRPTYSPISSSVRCCARQISISRRRSCSRRSTPSTIRRTISSSSCTTRSCGAIIPTATRSSVRATASRR